MFYNSILRGKLLDFCYELKVVSGENQQGSNRYDFALEMSNFCHHNANTSYNSIGTSLNSNKTQTNDLNTTVQIHSQLF